VCIQIRAAANKTPHPIERFVCITCVNDRQRGSRLAPQADSISGQKIGSMVLLLLGCSEQKHIFFSVYIKICWKTERGPWWFLQSNPCSGTLLREVTGGPKINFQASKKFTCKDWILVIQHFALSQIFVKKYQKLLRSRKKSVLTDLVVFSEIIIVWMSSVSLLERVDVPLARIWTVRRILFMFDIYRFIYHTSVPGEHEHPTSKRHKNFKFFDKAPAIFITFSMLYEQAIFLNKTS
jgi:hypothetical protein